jgi:cbb3-type cytochrome oxidase maturation protein
VDILLILIPMAIAMGAIFAVLFVRAARSGQFNDLDDPPIRMLQDD